MSINIKYGNIEVTKEVNGATGNIYYNNICRGALTSLTGSTKAIFQTNGKVAISNITIDNLTVPISGKIMTSDITITNNPTVVTIPSSPVAKTYTGGSQQCGIVAPTGTTMSGTISATNAGTYKITLALNNAFNYRWSDGTIGNKEISWTIDKANASVSTAPTNKGGTYSGAALEIANAGSCIGGTLYYKAANTSQTEYGTSIPTAVNAGSYRLYYYVKGDSNHNDTTETYIDCTIAKHQGYITLNSTSAGSCAWNGTGTRTISSSHGGTISVSSSNTTTCTVGISGSTITITGKNYNNGASSTITITCAATTNYMAASVSFTWTCYRTAGWVTLNSTAAGSCAWNSTGTRTVSSYHGGTLSVASSNTTTCTVSISGTTITVTGKNYNSGTASTITVTSAASGNYNAASATFSWTCSRTAGYVNLSTSSVSVDYGVTNTVTISSSHGGTLSASSSSTTYATVSLSGTTVTITGKAIGSATLTVSCAAYGNYNAASKTCSITIVAGTFAGRTETKNGVTSKSVWTQSSTSSSAGSGTIDIVGTCSSWFQLAEFTPANIMPGTYSCRLYLTGSASQRWYLFMWDNNTGADACSNWYWGSSSSTYLDQTRTFTLSATHKLQYTLMVDPGTTIDVFGTFTMTKTS